MDEGPRRRDGRFPGRLETRGREASPGGREGEAGDVSPGARFYMRRTLRQTMQGGGGRALPPSPPGDTSSTGWSSPQSSPTPRTSRPLFAPLALIDGHFHLQSHRAGSRFWSFGPSRAPERPPFPCHPKGPRHSAAQSRRPSEGELIPPMVQDQPRRREPEGRCDRRGAERGEKCCRFARICATLSLISEMDLEASAYDPISFVGDVAGATKRPYQKRSCGARPPTFVIVVVPTSPALSAPRRPLTAPPDSLTRRGDVLHCERLPNMRCSSSLATAPACDLGGTGRARFSAAPRLPRRFGTPSRAGPEHLDAIIDVSGESVPLAPRNRRHRPGKAPRGPPPLPAPSNPRSPPRNLRNQDASRVPAFNGARQPSLAPRAALYPPMRRASPPPSAQPHPPPPTPPGPQGAWRPSLTCPIGRRRSLSTPPSPTSASPSRARP